MNNKAQENQRFESIWDALEEHIKRRKLTQTQAAALFGVTQPRISDLKRGKIGLFSLDALINMAVTAGMKVEMRITERKPLNAEPQENPQEKPQDKAQEKSPAKKPKKTAAG